MVPKTGFRKVDGRTGVVRPGAVGVLAIIAAATSGTMNSAASYTEPADIKTRHGACRLHEFGATVLPQTAKPIVGVGVDASTDGAYSAITTTNGGTSVATAGAAKPVDALNVVIQFLTGATIGEAGATYKYSLDGGKTFSKVTALGTANNILIGDTGVQVAFAAGTVLATTKLEFTTTQPKITNADLPAALEALRLTTLPFDAVLVDMEADADTVALCDTWLKALAAKGRAKTVVLNARPQAADEDATEYRDALAAIFAAAESTDVLVCADRCDMPSDVRGVSMVRPFNLPVAIRGMQVGIGVDVAYVEVGALDGVSILDERSNPKYHNEDRTPGLDDLRLVVPRTIDGFVGVYVNNPNLLSPTGSDFVYWQHARCANRGIEIAYQIFTKQLSRGVRKNPEPGPNGERYIAESEAKLLEELANAQIFLELVQPGAVDDMRVVLKRTDDIRSNAGAKIRGAIEIVSLGYVKEWDFEVGYVTAIQKTTPGGGQ
jgi:hypothetical protein